MGTFLRYLGVIGLGMMMIGLLGMRAGHDTKAHEALYAAQGQSVLGEVLSQVQTSNFRGRRAQTRTTAYQLIVQFTLPDGTPVSKSLKADQPLYPSTDGRTWVLIRYLPQNPHDSAEIEGEANYDSGDGDGKIQSGLLCLGLGTIPLGIACLLEKAQILKFFGKSG